MGTRPEKRSWRFGWYRITFAAILVVPALVCQMVRPFVSYETWEDLSEPLFAQLLRFQEPAAAEPSKVVIVEVDQRTIDTYGWPIDRSYYVQLLLRLQEAGHPWVLSLFQFQELDKGRGTKESRSALAGKDQALAAAIKSYGRYVGSGLRIEPGAELESSVEESLMPRVTLSSRAEPGELPYLPLTLVESPRFVEAQAAFGYGAHFGTEPVIHCMQMYLTDRRHTGAFLIPSSFVWASAMATESRIVTADGPSWPRPGEKLPYSFKRRMRVAYKHCLTSPSVLTQDHLKQRGVQRVSLVELLESETPVDFTGKLVLLAPSEMRRFRGPGAAVPGDDGIIAEHLLTARFLDGLVSGHTIRRELLSRSPVTAWLPMALAGGLSVGSLFLSPLGAVFLTLAALGGLLAFTVVHLLDGSYLILTPAIASLGVTAIGLGILYAYLRYYGVRRQVRFAARLRESLSQCNTLDEVERFAAACCAEEFEYASLVFGDYEKALYLASSDANAALALLDKKGGEPAPDSQFAARSDTVQTNVKRLRGLTKLPLRSRGMQIALAVESKLGRLGTLRLDLTYRPHETGFIANLVDLLRIEVAQHWHRIKLLVDQKLLDYRFLMEQTRGDIMERFLTHVIVSKFSDNKTMMENLSAVLTPRPTRAALMQADIRGYSKISTKMAPLEMVRLLQRYYSNVVDAAQLVAQVKLIGDCIFLFIEDAAGTPDASPADLALELATILIKETRRQNEEREKRGEETLNFGIAIHYGEVVVGNLSSDSCIDYTVIGPNVNMVARLEELTKNPEINGLLGLNGVLVTPAAKDGMIRHKAVPFFDIALDQVGAAVRSFPDVKTLCGLTADMALGVPADRDRFGKKIAG